MDVEESVRLRLEILYAQLGKKHTFEEGVSNITTLLQDRYPDASPDLRKSVFHLSSFIVQFCCLLILFDLYFIQFYHFV